MFLLGVPCACIGCTKAKKAWEEHGSLTPKDLLCRMLDNLKGQCSGTGVGDPGVSSGSKKPPFAVFDSKYHARNQQPQTMSTSTPEVLISGRSKYPNITDSGPNSHELYSFWEQRL